MLLLQDLVLFALVAPVVAVLVFGVLRVLKWSSSSTFIAGCVLYSAGTFAYAACDHILPDLKGEARTWGSLAALCLGALLPCSLNLLDISHH